MDILHLTADTFDDAIASDAVLVDFWASWCMPCAMVAPVLEELAGEYAEKVTVAKVDVDAEGALAERYGVMSIPTVILFKGGLEAGRLVGVQPKEAYVEAINA